MNEQSLSFADYSNVALAASALSDGIVQIPVTDARLSAMLSGYAAEEEIGRLPTGRLVTIADIARVALVAGCRPSYMPVLATAFSIMLSPSFPIALLTSSQASYYPFVIVNGPIRARIELNCKSNVFGAGFRANATIGRALRLALAYLMGAPTGRDDPSALGTPYRFTCVIGEDEEDSPWPPFPTSVGMDEAQSTVTVLAALHPGHVTQQCSADPKHLLRTYADELTVASCFQRPDIPIPDAGWRPKAVIAIGEDHRNFFRTAGWDRGQMKRYLHQVTTRRAGKLRAAGYYSDPRIVGAADDKQINAYQDADDFIIVSAGSGGGRAMVVPAFYGETRPIDERASSAAFAAPTNPPSTMDDFAAMVDRYIDQGATEGWPVIPPYAESVSNLIAATGRNPTDVIGNAPWRPQPITVQDIAVNALMAGCQPEHMPLCLSMMELLFSREADTGVGAAACSTHGYACWFVIQGPIAREVGINSGNALFGPGSSANVILGRTARLAMRNLAGLKPNLADRSCLGQAATYGVVFAESETGPWGQTELGQKLKPNESGFTLFWGQHPRLTINNEVSDAESLLRGIAENISTGQTYDSLSARSPGETTMAEGTAALAGVVLNRSLAVVLSSGHQRILRDAGWSREKVQIFLAEHGRRTAADIRAMGFGTSPLVKHGANDADLVPIYAPNRIFLISAGGDGGATMTWPILFYNCKTFP